MNFIYILLFILVLNFFYRNTKDLLHPSFVFLSIWLVTSSISCVDQNNFLSPWSIKMHFVVLLSSITFFAGSLIHLTSIEKRVFGIKERLTNKKFTSNTRILFVICLFCFLIEWVKGGMFIFSTAEIGLPDMKSEIDGDIPGIHYGTIFLPFTAVLSFFNLQGQSNNKKIEVSIIIINIIISFFFKISRGDLIIYILSFLFIYSRFNKIKFRLIFVSVTLMIIMFAGVMMLRVNEESIVVNTTNNPVFSIFYTYIATCYANLNDLINHDYAYHLIGSSTLAPLWSFFGIKNNFEVVSLTQLEMFNARTYLYSFYHDFKLFGVILVPFLMGLFTSYLYKMTLTKPHWIILLATLQKAIFTPFFGNYFFGELVILFPYLITAVLIMISYTNPNKIEVNDQSTAN